MKIQRIMPATTHSMKDALPLGTILTVKNVADQKYIVVGYDTSSVPHNYYAVPMARKGTWVKKICTGRI